MEKNRILAIFLILSLIPISLTYIPKCKAQIEPNSFGNPTYKALNVNWSQFWNLFNKYSVWDLEYRNATTEWTSIKQDLQIIKNQTVCWKIKISLNFTSSYQADYRLTFGIQLDVKTYIYKSDKYKYVISYKNHTVFFDWNDLSEIKGLIINHGIKPVGDESWFWFRIRKDNVPKGYNILLDPSFGHEEAESSYQNTNNRITGSVFTITEDGTANSITAYICLNNIAVKCAIYKHSDSSLIGNTTERTITNTCPPDGDNWETFTFSDPKPTLTANFEYVLVCWSDGLNYIHYHENQTNEQGHFDTESYNGFPNPATFTHEDREYSIFCNYTSVGLEEYSEEFSEFINVSDSFLSSKSKMVSFSEILTPSALLVSLKETKLLYLEFLETIEPSSVSVMVREFVLPLWYENPLNVGVVVFLSFLGVLLVYEVFKRGSEWV